MDGEFQPLNGIRVIETSHMIMGPSCGMFLAFLGAEVIKVEPPEGDKTRHLTGMGSGFFPTFNRGKRSVSLNLKSQAGKAAFEKLLESADVFVENFRDSSLAEMGFDPASLQAKFPRLIVASHKGFLHGPYQDRTALDEVVQMMTGIAYMTGPTGRPLRIGSSANDIMAGLFGAFSVLASLMEREKTGRARAVRVGLFENCLLLVAQHMVQFDIEGAQPPPMPERTFSWPVYDIFDTMDGKQLFVGAVTEGQWLLLCGELGLNELLDDERLQTRMDLINARDWTLPVFAKAIAKRSTDSLAKAFEKLGIPFSPIAKPADMYDDPHVNRPGGLILSELPDGRTFRAPGLPFEIDDQMVGQQANLPDIGEDTQEILEGLGLDKKTIEAARGRKMAATS
jgi:crotonobetainyl-CoA:carnitine CoA-transferase CaiB-like acyl-CoA transferase